MLHGHILPHEDAGPMQNVLIAPRNSHGHLPGHDRKVESGSQLG